MSSKVLSYQMQLAPKINTRMRRFRAAVISAADDYRVLMAAESADAIDRNMRTLKQRTGDMQKAVEGLKQKEQDAAARYERYLGHVKRLEEEVLAAKAHAATAEQDLQSAKRESAAQVLASDGL
jgi:septation ring formation regulator EzrA